MRRDRIRNLFAAGFGLILVGGAVVAMSGASLQPADLTFVNGAEIESLDPAKVTGVPEGRALRAVFSGLTVQAADSNESLPDLAESWEIKDGGKTYVFKLRENARWSNGDPLTAEDFVYSWRRLFKPDTGAKYAYLLWPIAGSEEYTKEKGTAEEVGVSAPDPHTFVVKLREPTPYFIYLTAFYPSFPVHRATVEEYPDTWHTPEHFVGSGPFKVQLRQIRDRLRLVKNDHYWNADKIDVRSVDVLPLEDLTTALNLYLTGVVDWVTDVPPHVIPELMKRGDFDPRPRLGTYFFRINQNNKDPRKKKFFGNLKVRRALYLATDRKAICERVTRAGDLPARGIVPPGLDGYEAAKLPDYDPERARKLLAEALDELGWERAPRFTLVYNTREDHKAVCEVLQAQWRQTLGLDVTLENMEWQSYLKNETSFDYDVSRAGWIGDYPDPNTFLDLWQTGNKNNRTGFASKEYDALIVKASRTMDAKARLAILKQCEQMLLDEQIIIPIYHYVTKNLVRPWVRGWKHNVQDRHNLQFISIDRELRRKTIGR